MAVVDLVVDLVVDVVVVVAVVSKHGAVGGDLAETHLLSSKEQQPKQGKLP